MPELTISVGGKDFTVGCQAGEEPFLRSAAALLDREAQTVVASMGRLTDAKMLLMAGLMLADRTAAFEEQVAAQKTQMETMQGTAPVLPDSALQELSQLADRAEALAQQIEAKGAAG